MAGEKMTAGQASAAKAASRMTALKRAADGGKVTAHTGKKKEEDAIAQEAANAAKVAAEKAAADKAHKAGQEAAKKKKLSALDIAMGRR